jgi:hypothetical protein
LRFRHRVAIKIDVHFLLLSSIPTFLSTAHDHAIGERVFWFDRLVIFYGGVLIEFLVEGRDVPLGEVILRVESLEVPLGVGGGQLGLAGAGQLSDHRFSEAEFGVLVGSADEDL